MGTELEDLQKAVGGYIEVVYPFDEPVGLINAFHLLNIKRESEGFGFGEIIGSNWWIALILGILLTIFGLIVILNPMLGLGVIGVLVGCSVITAGINLIYLGCSPWLL